MMKWLVIGLLIIGAIAAFALSQSNNKAITEPLNTLSGSQTLDINKNMQNSIKKSTDMVEKQYKDNVPGSQ